MSASRQFAPWLWLLLALAIIGGSNELSARLQTTDRLLAADNAHPDGALGLHLWLTHLGYHVSVTGDPPAFSRLTPRNSTLMFLAAHSGLPPSSTSAALDWVRRGGRLVLIFTSSQNSALGRALGLSVQTTDPAPIRVHEPLLLSPPVTQLTGTASLAVAGPPAAVPVASTRDMPVVLRQQRARGIIWAVSAYTMLENRAIARGDNRRLALNLAGARGSDVLLNEYIPPAAGAAVTDWLTQTVWGVVLIFGATVVLLYLWLGFWRLGPPVQPLSTHYRATTEYIVSLAALLQRSRAHVEVLALYQLSLRRALRRRYGDIDGPPDGVEGDVADLLRPRSRLSEADLVRQVAAIVAREGEVEHRHG